MNLIVKIDDIRVYHQLPNFALVAIPTATKPSFKKKIVLDTLGKCFEDIAETKNGLEKFGYERAAMVCNLANTADATIIDATITKGLIGIYEIQILFEFYTSSTVTSFENNLKLCV